MADKKLTISTILDTSSFDASVKKMQQDLAKINSPNNTAFEALKNAERAKSMGVQGLGEGPGKDAFQRATSQSRQQMEEKLRQETQIGKAARTNADQHQNQIRILERGQAKYAAGSEKELKIKELLIAKERELMSLRTQAAASAKNQASILDAMDKNAKQAASPIAGGAPPPSTAPAGGISVPQAPQDPAAGGGANLLKMIGGVAAIAGIVQRVVGTSLAVYRASGEAPLNASVNQGSAMSGTFGSELRNAYGGRSGIESAYLPQKQAAVGVAEANLANRKTSDKYNVGGRILGAAAVGGAAGAIFGPPGAAIGAGVGLIGGTASVLTDQRLRALSLGSLGNEKFKREYESMNAKEYAENYQTDLDAEKKKNPLKTMALEQYQGSYLKNLDFQRSTGLDYSSFHGAGGFRENTMNAGFSDDMGMGMGSAILGAGGSTRSAQGNSVLGLQMQRGFGMTNAGSVLGTLSSGM